MNKYFPSKVSCELGVTEMQENILAISLYISLAVTILCSIFITNSLGPRKTALLALYMSIVFTVLCAAVPNYWTLLLSRIMIGVGIGLNLSPSGLFFADGASCKKVYIQGTFIWVLLWEASGAWVGALGYVALKYVSWREFLLLTSVPVFIPPIFMLHFVLTEDAKPKEECQPILENSETSRKFPTLRLAKASVCYFLQEAQLYGLIILLPGLLRSINMLNNGSNNDNDPCSGVVQGSDFISLTIINSGMILGIILAGLLHNRLPPRLVYPAVAALTTVCFVVLYFYQSTYWLVVVIGFMSYMFSKFQEMRLSLLQYDADYFGRENITVCSGVMYGIATLGSVFGTTCAAFLNPGIEVFIALGFLFMISLIFLK